MTLTDEQLEPVALAIGGAVNIVYLAQASERERMARLLEDKR